MSTVDPVLKSTKDTPSIIRDFSKMLAVNGWKKTPFLSLIAGGTDDKPALKSLSSDEGGMFTSDKWEWQDDDIRRPVVTINAMLIGDLVITPTVAADGFHLVTGMVVQVDSEQMLVTTGGISGAVTVTRAYGGTVAAAHSAAAKCYMVTRLTLEDHAYVQDPVVLPNQAYNVGQQFVETYGISDAEQGLNRYFAKDGAAKLERMRMQAANNIFRQLQANIFWSRSRVAWTETVRGQFGGARMFMDAGNIYNLAAAALTANHVNDLLQAQNDNFGTENVSDLIVVDGKGKRKITQLFGTGLVTVQAQRTDKQGGIALDSILTDFGDLDVMLINHLPPNTMWFFKRDNLGMGPLAGNEMQEYEIGRTRTRTDLAMQGIYTYEQRLPGSHGLLENWT